MKINWLVAIGVLIVVGVIMTAIVDTVIKPAVNTDSRKDNVASVAANGTITLANLPVNANSQTVELNGTDLVEDTDYTIVDATGVITLQGQAPGGYSGNVTYNSEPTEYLSLSTTRVAVTYIPVFVILSLFVFVASGLFIKFKGKK